MQMNGNLTSKPMGGLRPGFMNTWEGFLPQGAIVMAKKGMTAPMSQSAEIQTHADFEFYFLTDVAISSDEAALFEKITQALGLSPEHFRVGSDLSASVHSKVCVRFGTGQSQIGEWSEVSVGERKVPSISTHSLGNLVRDPSLKKETWNHLKLACEKIGYPILKQR